MPRPIARRQKSVARSNLDRMLTGPGRPTREKFIQNRKTLQFFIASVGIAYNSLSGKELMCLCRLVPLRICGVGRNVGGKMINGHILVVDDEPQIRRVMRMTLVGEGYGVSGARCGDDALELLRSEKYDLVLLDVNMPGISGMQACREIRAGSDLPIIMLTV